MPKIETLTVEVNSLDNNAAPQGGQVTLSLIDATLADAPADAISKVSLNWGGEFPFTLPLPFDGSQIEDKREYAIAVLIENDDQLMYTSTSHYPVEAGISTYQVVVEKAQSGTDSFYIE